jgi:(2Fe-2S) ferredoxin
MEHSTAYTIWVCQQRECQQRGSAAVLREFVAHTHDRPSYQVQPSDCQGQCHLGATVRIQSIADDNDIWYCQLQPGDAAAIVAEHLDQGSPLTARLHPRWHPRMTDEETVKQ